MKLTAFIILLLLNASFAQQKYMIYFKDKGNADRVMLKGSPEYNTALSELSERSIERRKKHSKGEIISFEDIPVNREYMARLKESGIEIINVLKWFNAVSASLTDEQVRTVKDFSFIQKIEPVKVFRSGKREQTSILEKEDPLSVVQRTGGQQYDSLFYGPAYTQLRLSDIPRVHRKNITGKGVLLGVLDSGFKWKTHEALSGANVLAEYDFVFKDSVTQNQTGDISDQHNHGTSVFSVISGKKENTLIGAAFDADYILAKTEDIRTETRVEEDNYAAALEWMESFGVDITTASLGYSQFDNFSYSYNDMDGNTTLVTKAAEIAFSKGILIINSAGNEGNSPWKYITAPSDGFNVISVGAVSSTDILMSFSSRGPTADGRIKPDVVAMGSNVYGASAIVTNGYGSYGGTSLAAPIAAGTAVLLLSAHPHLTNEQMRDIILRTAANYTSPNNSRGYGLILAGDAIEYPNLSTAGGRNVLNKLFLTEGIEDVKIHYSEDTINFTEEILTGDSIHFNFVLPDHLANRIIRFYYTYAENGVVNRVPYNGYYSLMYGNLTSVKVEDGLPVDYILSNNYPNPFNNNTRINFFIKDLSDVQLDIYNALGQKVRTLYSASSVSGEFSVEWNGRADNGTYCASGMYIYRLNIGGNNLAKKMILLK